MMKLKLLFYGDFYKLASGFAKEFRTLIKYLPKDVEIRQVGLDYNGLTKTDIFVYPTSLKGIRDYWSAEILEHAIEDFKPDIVLTIQDYYILPAIIQVLSKPRKWKMKWINWGVIDGAPLNHHHAICSSWAHLNLVHSKFGKYALEDQFELAYKSKGDVRVLYPPIDLEIFKPLEKTNLRKKYRTEERFVVLMIGRNQFRKNIPVLMEAVKKASKRISNIQLLLHSLPTKRPDGSEESYDLQGLVKEMDLIKYISALRTSGPITDELINEIYNSVDIHCMPTMGEGFGLPLAESMAVGIPNIATNCSSITEILADDRGYLVNPASWVWAGGITKHAILNSDDLANGIIKLWENPLLREDIKRNSLEWVKGSEAEKITTKLINLCQETLDKDLEPLAKQK
jgi:glycosyltransferase involved in cell wall biosynthesis